MLQLRVSMRYLKDVLQMQFPQIRARAAAAEAEARARQVWMQSSHLGITVATWVSCTRNRDFWLSNPLCKKEMGHAVACRAALGCI